MTRRITGAICLFILVLLLVECGRANVTSGELNALNDLYLSTNGKEWVNKTNWQSGDPCANSWYGVLCTNNHVTGLLLSNNGMYGSLPLTLGNLYALETLLLDSNQLSGPIPTSLNQIKSLGKIDLHGNFISSTIPSELGSLLQYNLEYLDLSNNHLTGDIPSFFNSPPSYFYANLSGNLFTCPIPSWAVYTSANCIDWIISAVEPICSIPFAEFNLFGANFLEIDGIQCSIYNTTNGQLLGQSPAKVISSSHILCYANHTFQRCNPYPGYQTFINVDVKLTLNGGVVTGNYTQRMGILNSACQFGTIQAYSSINYKIPTVLQAMSMCSLGNPTPFSCPSSLTGYSNKYIPSEFDENCSDTHFNQTCYWAAPYYSTSTPSCPYYYCKASYYGGKCTFSSYCPNGYSCYGPYSDCISSSTCIR